MTTRHISTAFDNDLDELDRLIGKMGNLALTQFIAVIEGMGQKDDDLKSLIANDRLIDQIEIEVYNKTVEIIAIRAPQANDLRHIIIAPKIASFFERIGDYSKNIMEIVNSTFQMIHWQYIPIDILKGILANADKGLGYEVVEISGTSECYINISRGGDKFSTEKFKCS